MVEKLVFVKNMREMLSVGVEKKEILDYVCALGVSEKEANELLAEAEKGFVMKGKAGISMKPLTMEQQIQRFKKQKTESGKEQFRENIEALSEMVKKINKDIQESKEGLE